MKDRRDPPARTEEQAVAEHEARVLEYIRKAHGHVCQQPKHPCSDCPYRITNRGTPRKRPGVLAGPRKPRKAQARK